VSNHPTQSFVTYETYKAPDPSQNSQLYHLIFNAKAFGGTTMKSEKLAQFLHCLQNDLTIPAASLQLALQHPEQTPRLLPIILWQYGLVTLT
jgi:hypothetical protein